MDLALSHGGHKLLASHLTADHCELNLKLCSSREVLGRNKDQDRAGHIRLKFITWPPGWEDSTRTAKGRRKFCAPVLTVFEMF